MGTRFLAIPNQHWFAARKCANYPGSFLLTSGRWGNRPPRYRVIDVTAHRETKPPFFSGGNSSLRAAPPLAPATKKVSGTPASNVFVPGGKNES